MKLLQSQKNLIFEIIQESNLSPALFEIYDKRSLRNTKNIDTRINYKNSDFYFIFGTSKDSPNKHYAIFSPGETNYRDEKNTYTWENQVYTFKNWLEYLNREIKATDKWKRLNEEVGSLGFVFDQDEDKFNVEEFEEIKSKIGLLKEKFQETNLLEEELKAINQKLDSLTESAKHMNKFDWKSLFVGTFVSIIIQLKVTPENANIIWSVIKDVFSNYLIK